MYNSLNDGLRGPPGPCICSEKTESEEPTVLTQPSVVNKNVTYACDGGCMENVPRSWFFSNFLHSKGESNSITIDLVSDGTGYYPLDVVGEPNKQIGDSPFFDENLDYTKKVADLADANIALTTASEAVTSAQVTYDGDSSQVNLDALNNANAEYSESLVKRDELQDCVDNYLFPENYRSSPYFEGNTYHGSPIMENNQQYNWVRGVDLTSKAHKIPFFLHLRMNPQVVKVAIPNSEFVKRVLTFQPLMPIEPENVAPRTEDAGIFFDGKGFKNTELPDPIFFPESSAEVQNNKPHQYLEFIKVNAREAYSGLTDTTPLRFASTNPETGDKYIVKMHLNYHQIGKMHEYFPENGTTLMFPPDEIPESIPLNFLDNRAILIDGGDGVAIGDGGGGEGGDGVAISDGGDGVAISDGGGGEGGVAISDGGGGVVIGDDNPFFPDQVGINSMGDVPFRCSAEISMVKAEKKLRFYTAKITQNTTTGQNPNVHTWDDSGLQSNIGSIEGKYATMNGSHLFRNLETFYAYECVGFKPTKSGTLNNGDDIHDYDFDPTIIDCKNKQNFTLVSDPYKRVDNGSGDYDMTDSGIIDNAINSSTKVHVQVDDPRLIHLDYTVQSEIMTPSLNGIKPVYLGNDTYEEPTIVNGKSPFGIEVSTYNNNNNTEAINITGWVITISKTRDTYLIFCTTEWVEIKDDDGCGSPCDTPPTDGSQCSGGASSSGTYTSDDEQDTSVFSAQPPPQSESAPTTMIDGVSYTLKDGVYVPTSTV